MTNTIHRQSNPARICILIILIISIGSLISYVIGDWKLVSFGSDYVPMAPLTAIIFIALSVSILLQSKEEGSDFDYSIVRIFVILIALVCSFSIIHAVMPWGPDIEESLIQIPDQVSGIPVGNMSPITATIFIFVSLSFLWGISSRRKYRNLSPILATIILSIGLIVIEGYWYNTPLLYGGTLIPVALTTGICFLLIGIALLYLRKDDTHLGDSLFGHSVKARLLRTFLPVMIFFVLLEGWVFSILVFRPSLWNPVLWSGIIAVVLVGIIVVITTVLSRQIGGVIDLAESERDRSDTDLRQAHSKLTDAYIQLGIQEKNLLQNFEEIASREEELSAQNEELVRRQIALERSEEKFRIVADYTYDWETWESPDGEIIYISPSCERITGYTPNEYKNRTISFTQIVHPLDLDRWEHHIHEAKTTPDYFSLEFRIMRRDGGIRWIHHVCQPIIIPSGENLGRRGSNRDVTLEKEIQEALRNRDAQYQLISENSADVIWLLNLSSGSMRYVSPSIYKLRGYTPDEVMKQSLQDILTPESFTLVSEQLPVRISRFLSGDESQRVQTHEVYQPHKDGTIIPTEVVTTLILGESGEVEEILGVSRNIRERKNAEHQIKMAITQINQNLETLAILNDQIRNPLMIIELISDSLGGDSSEKIHSQVVKIDDLIRQVDNGFVRSEKVRGYLTRHYNITFNPKETETENS